MRALILLLLLAPSAAAITSPVHEVTIELSGGSALFTPLVLVIRAGESVFWTNNDWSDARHVVAGPGVDTGYLDARESSEPVVFDEPGTYFYHCPLHASMRNQQILVI